MRRVLPLLALAALPVAVAAPVPPGGRTEFGHNGLLSRADLEKVRFDTQLVKIDRGDDPAEIEEKGARNERPGAPRRANRYDVAVHLPWARFRAHEPMPVYLVLRNNRDSALRFRSRIDLSGGTPELQGGNVAVDVRDRATGRSVLAQVSAATNCGGGSLVDVPPFGFYCVKGDLNRISGAPLPPGEYEVDWRCGALAAAPVRFAVVPSDLKPVPPAAPTHTHFYHLQPGFEDEPSERADGRVEWRESHPNSVRYESLAAALAVGQGGAYVPDVRAIPTADKLVEAWAVWKPYRDGDRVAVTLRAAPPHRAVRFAQLPELFLQVETPAGSERVRWGDSPEQAKQARDGRAALVTPLTIEARLPDGWREWLGYEETAGVAVLVASKEIEFPRGAERAVEKAKELRIERAANTDRPPVWSGVVRTDFTELRLPPAPPSGSTK